MQRKCKSGPSPWSLGSLVPVPALWSLVPVPGPWSLVPGVPGAAPKALGLPWGFGVATCLWGFPRSLRLPKGYEVSPGLRGCPGAWGLSQGFGFAPRLRSCPKAQGWPQALGVAPQLWGPNLHLGSALELRCRDQQVLGGPQGKARCPRMG